MGDADKAGVESVPFELLEAKSRLRYDSEKMQFVDVSAESTVHPLNDELDGPPDGPGIPTEIPVSDSRGLPDGSGSVRRPDGHGIPAEIPVSDSLVPQTQIDDESSSRSTSTKPSARSSSQTSGPAEDFWTQFE